MEKIENKNIKIVWMNGEPLIDISHLFAPQPIQIRVVQLPMNGKDPFKQMLDEIRKFMGGLSDADKEK